MTRIGADGRVASPCISVCRMEEATGLCAGCLRTLDEIAMWSVLDDEDRRAVWAEISMRAMRLAGKVESDAQR
jgi:predicted Fe-S protein YdhL (DUF1289 family)